MNIKKFFIILILMVSLKAYSQDPQFSQFYANPLYLNPAFAGSNICPRVILNYRNQWPAIPGTFVTYNASYDQYFDGIKGGLGFLINQDNQGQGVITTTTGSAIYSYNLEVTRQFSIKAGFQASFFAEHLNWDKLVFGDQIDDRYGFVRPTQEIPPSNPNKYSLDFSSGLLGYSEKFYFGFAAHHLTQPVIGFYSQSTLPIKYTVHAGANLSLSGRGNGTARDEYAPSISPNILYQKQQEFQQVNIGLYVNKFPFVGGLWYRQSVGAKSYPDAFIVLLGLQTNMMKFGYSYDITISKLTLASGGAHEFSFALKFGCPAPRKRAIRAINCPTF